jgi:AcrR family transcriptional regulator
MEALAAQPKWQRRADARPQEILDAAYRVFTEKGFVAARMDDIAQAAGVTKGTVYLYFDSKETVFKALIVGAFSERFDRLTALLADFDGSCGELLAQVLRALGEFVATSDRIGLPKIVIGEIGRFPEIAKFYRHEVIGRGMKLWEAILKRGTARGEFREVPIEHAIRLCSAPILLAAIWRTTFAQFDEQPYDIAGLIEAHIDMLLRGLRKEGQ